MTYSVDEASYLTEICNIIVKDCGFAKVWIGYAENDKNKSVKLVASAGFEKDYLKRLKFSWTKTDQGLDPVGSAIKTGDIIICRNIKTDPKFKPWRVEAIKHGYASWIVFPLRESGFRGYINLFN